jgi:starch synthase
MQRFNLRQDLPLITFIGRLVNEKGADLIPEAIAKYLYDGGRASFVVLGTGDPALKDKFVHMKQQFVSFFDTSLEYNETLSHQLYAGSDFLMMPSRVEPCGLNQLYAFKYGTIPIVRTTGGLADTVIDFSSGNGTGLRFDDFSVEALAGAFKRAALLYERKELLWELIEKIMDLDYSWQKSAQKYLDVYNKITSKNQ